MTQVATLLIDARASVNHATNNGRTALINSCWKGHSEIAKLLIGKGADVRLASRYGDTALTSSCHKGLAEVATLLIGKGADVHHRDRDGKTAREHASAKGHTACVELLKLLEPCAPLAWTLVGSPPRDTAPWLCAVVDATIQRSHSPLDIDLEAADAALARAASHADAVAADIARLHGQLDHARTAQRLASEGSSCCFHFVWASALRDDAALERLPSLQELRTHRPAWLATRTIDFAEACRGSYAHSIVAVSHRWDNPSQPDPSGEQLRALQVYLRAHPHIELVFYDFCSMAQGQRAPHERHEFQMMLPNINIVYLGCAVLILMDRTYLGRFW